MALRQVAAQWVAARLAFHDSNPTLLSRLLASILEDSLIWFPKMLRLKRGAYGSEFIHSIVATRLFALVREVDKFEYCLICSIGELLRSVGRCKFVDDVVGNISLKVSQIIQTFAGGELDPLLGRLVHLGRALRGLREKSDKKYDSITLLLTEQSSPAQILYIVDYIHKILEKEITIHLLYTPQTLWNRLLIADFTEHISKYLEEKYGIKLKESQEEKGIVATPVPTASPVLIRAILKDRIPNNSIVIAQGMLIPSLLALIEGWREGANKVVLL